MNPPISRALERTTADWLAKRDRGLSPAEEADFQAWLAAPAHARAWQELAGPFQALDRAARLRPPGVSPDPDLLAPAARSSRGPRAALWLAAAAALALGTFWFARPSPAPTAPANGTLVVHDTPQRLTLPDGSIVEFKFGARVTPAFTARERRVDLPDGEAQFTVAKDPARPFIVRVGGVEVRAIGTIFTVTASSAAVEVVVTEGRVRVDDTAGRNLVVPAPTAVPTQTPPAALNAGQFVVIPTSTSAPVPAPAQSLPPQAPFRSGLTQDPWLEFADMPLAEVASAFNRLGARQSNVILKVANAATGRVRVSGTFRADQAAAFVRVLQSTFGLSATAAPDGSVTLQKD